MVRLVPKADTEQMILEREVTVVEQSVTARHLRPAESHSNKCNSIRGQPSIREGRSASPKRPRSRPRSQGNLPSTISDSRQIKGYI